MYFKRRRGWEIPERLATPEAVWLNRREIVAGGAALFAAGALPAFAETDPTAGLYPVARNSRYGLDRPVTPEAINVNYNNFLEFGRYKQIARAAAALPIRPWQVAIEGLVEKPLVLGIDELIRKVGLEERLYRHRSVDGWSMTVPWTGFPLAALVGLARPLAGARYLRMESFLDPRIASGQNSFYPWPYAEGLTIAEAANELAFMVTGAYGKPLAKSMGAPLRMHLPWKYGFKSLKAVVRVTFAEERPAGFWPRVLPDEYGFWANVNPDVPHPRRNQKSERDIATGETLPTRLFNGYGDFVAGLYAGMEGEALYV